MCHNGWLQKSVHKVIILPIHTTNTRAFFPLATSTRHFEVVVVVAVVVVVMVLAEPPQRRCKDGPAAHLCNLSLN